MIAIVTARIVLENITSHDRRDFESYYVSIEEIHVTSSKQSKLLQFY